MRALAEENALLRASLPRLRAGSRDGEVVSSATR
jgi:hypothetical protein